MQQKLFVRTNLQISRSMIYRKLHEWKFTVQKSFAVQRAKYMLSIIWNLSIGSVN